MGIVHIGLVKLKEGVSTEAIEIMQKDLLAFKEEIPGIQYISAGTNFSPLSQGFDFAFVLRFSSKEDVDTYMSHPTHLASIEKTKEYVENVVIVDYEG